MKEDEVLFLGSLAVQKSPKLGDQEGDHHILNLNLGLLHFDAAQKLLGQDCRNSVRILASLEQHRDDELLSRFLLRFQNPPSCWFSVQQKIQELNQILSDQKTKWLVDLFEL